MWDSNVKLDSEEEEIYRNVFNRVTKRVLKKAKELNKHLTEVFNSANYDSAFEQGLKAKGRESTFTLYIEFKLPNTKWKLLSLGDDDSRPADCVLHIPEPASQEAWQRLVDKSQDGKSSISPSKMNALLVQALDQALGNMKSSVNIGRDTYSVSRQQSGPSTSLLVSGPGVDFAVHLVPCFTLLMKHLKGSPALMKNIEEILMQAQLDTKSFKVVASSTKLEATFPEIEQTLLKNSGCLGNVMTRLQHHVNTKGEVHPVKWAGLLRWSKLPTQRFCQHIIFGLFFRACVLPLVLEHLGVEGFWAESNLELRERDCLQSIYSKLQNGFVADMFFPQVIFSSFLCLVGQLLIFPVQTMLLRLISLRG